MTESKPKPLSPLVVTAPPFMTRVDGAIPPTFPAARTAYAFSPLVFTMTLVAVRLAFSPVESRPLPWRPDVAVVPLLKVIVAPV
ncbi:hypothetical protein D3C87_1515390 [compost metagenome]